MANKGHFEIDCYDPVTYWNNREQPNDKTGSKISKEHADFFSKHCQPGSRILDVGPGNGRLFPLFKDAKNSMFTTIDIAKRHKDIVAKAAIAENLIVRQFFVDSPDAPYPFRDAQFDIGVNSFVFPNVPFLYIDFAVSELARVAKKVIVFAMVSKDHPASLFDCEPHHHVFAHDYESIIDRNGLIIYDQLEDKETEPGNVRKVFVYGRP